MTVTAYDLKSFIDDLRAITRATDDPRECVGRVRPLVRDLALSRTWLRPEHYRCDEAQGFGVHVLHQEEDHRLAVFAVAWLPGRGAPPHNHGTWAVVAGVDGPERNVFWKRVDDRSRPGYAEIVRNGEKIFDAGDVVSFLPDSIHSVVNDTAAVTVSLHVYGMHVNYTARSQFDPDTRVEQEFKVTQAAG
jgi:predicted metal-dependent enzyme (double-stranded beta helix superfamily)